MDGFKNSTKMQTGHSFSKGSKCPDYASGPRNVFATGGIVTPFKAPDRSAGMSAPRPIMPRPHVMPNLQKVGMPRRMASGGKVGSTLEQPIPYSQIESEYPRKAARPGYKKGGKLRGKTKFGKKCEGGRAVGYAGGGQVGCDTDTVRRVADQEVAKHVKSKPPQGHGVKPRGNLAFMSKPMFGKG